MKYEWSTETSRKSKTENPNQIGGGSLENVKITFGFKSGVKSNSHINQDRGRLRSLALHCRAYGSVLGGSCSLGQSLTTKGKGEESPLIEETVRLCYFYGLHVGHDLRTVSGGCYGSKTKVADPRCSEPLVGGVALLNPLLHHVRVVRRIRLSRSLSSSTPIPSTKAFDV
jgi:hypothetical protein